MNPYQEITDQVIELMNSGVVPWRRPWGCAVGGLPQNAISKKDYRGINVLLTLMTMWNRGYSLPYFLTFKQANALAAKAAAKAGHKVTEGKFGWVFEDGPNKGKSVGGVRKGQNAANNCGASKVVFWKALKKKELKDDGNEKEVSVPMLRLYSVFNIEQCDRGVIEYVVPEAQFDDDGNFVGVGDTTKAKIEPIAAAQAIVDNYSVTISWDEDGAWYRSDLDTIGMPRRASFHSSEELYSTLFHEFGHSTGHPSRLHRKPHDGTKIHAYSFEELVAEFTAAFLCGRIGITQTIENSAAYLRFWAAKLQEDPRLIIRATQNAQKAADFVLGEINTPAEDIEEAA